MYHWTIHRSSPGSRWARGVRQARGNGHVHLVVLESWRTRIILFVLFDRCKTAKPLESQDLKSHVDCVLSLNRSINIVQHLFGSLVMAPRKKR